MAGWELVTNVEWARARGISLRTLERWEGEGRVRPAHRINGRKYRRRDEQPLFDEQMTRASVNAAA